MENTNTNEWEDRYQAGQTGWDRGISSNNLMYWIDNNILAPCRILVPGCGNGYEVLTLAEKGFDVTAIDIAPTAIENLQAALDKKNLKAELILADFFSWQPDTVFDAIYEQTSLCALPANEWQKYAAQLYQWLKPEGKLLAQFMQTGKEGGPPYHCEMKDMRELFSDDKWLWSKEQNAQEMESGKLELQYILEKR